MLIDSHIHLQSQVYQEDREEVIARAVRAGVYALLIPGTDLETSREAVRIADTHSSSDCSIFAAVGVHPTDAHTLTNSAVDELSDLATHPRVVAIGEIGLDYYWIHNQKRDWYCASAEEQLRALEIQLQLAKMHNMPVIIHDRDAHEDTLQTIEQWLRDHPTGKGTFHAYAGGIKHLERALATGFYIGIDGPVTFRKARSLHAVAQAVPLDRLLLETDGPYLTPEPFRGKRNEPAYIALIRDAVADIRGTSSIEVETATTTNVSELFKVG